MKWAVTQCISRQSPPVRAYVCQIISCRSPLPKPPPRANASTLATISPIVAQGKW